MIDKFTSHNPKNRPEDLLKLESQAISLYEEGDLVSAMEIFKEVEGTFIELKDVEGMIRTIGNQAVILQEWNELEGATLLNKQVEQLCRNIGDKRGLAKTLGNQGIIFDIKHDYKTSFDFHMAEENLYRELGDMKGIENSIAGQALSLYHLGDLDNAMILFKKQESICLDLNENLGLIRSLGNQALILFDTYSFDSALAINKKVEIMSRDLGYKEGLINSLLSQSLIYKAKWELEKAMALSKEVEGLCNELGDEDIWIRSLGNQAAIYHDLGNFDMAMLLYKRVEKACQDKKDWNGLATAFQNQGMIHDDQKKYDEAMKYFNNVESLSRKHNFDVLLAQSLGSQALISMINGDYLSSEQLNKEAVALYRKVRDIRGLIITLINQVVEQRNIGNLDKSYRLAEEAHNLSKEYKLYDLVEKSEQVIKRQEFVKITENKERTKNFESDLPSHNLSNLRTIEYDILAKCVLFNVLQNSEYPPQPVTLDWLKTNNYDLRKIKPGWLVFLNPSMIVIKSDNVDYIEIKTWSNMELPGSENYSRKVIFKGARKDFVLSQILENKYPSLDSNKVWENAIYRYSALLSANLHFLTTIGSSMDMQRQVRNIALEEYKISTNDDHIDINYKPFYNY